MKITKLEKLTQANELDDKVTITTIADPLLNIDHNQRVPLTLNKKQCGTIIPVVLYMGLKLRYLTENNLSEEPDDGIDSIVQSSLRQTLMEIRKMGETLQGTVYYGKTLQEKVFRHLVYNEPLSVTSKKEILTGEDHNKAHTVSNGTVQGENPSFTVPCYLCRYLLEEEGLNTGADYTHINPALKKQAKAAFSQLKEFDKSLWENDATFSRRVQNLITLNALKKVFSSAEIEYKLKHPYY